MLLALAGGIEINLTNEHRIALGIIGALMD